MDKPLAHRYLNRTKTEAVGTRNMGKGGQAGLLSKLISLGRPLTSDYPLPGPSRLLPIDSTHALL